MSACDVIIIIINFSQKTRVTQKAGPANMFSKRTSTRTTHKYKTKKRIDFIGAYSENESALVL